MDGKPNPDWIGAYFMSQDHELMLTTEELDQAQFNRTVHKRPYDGEPYVILHKVRGEPAFDIARLLMVEDEGWWIIPTSGHRAYPCRWYKLDALNQFTMDKALEEVGNAEWDSLPDHYTVSTEKVGRLTNLLTKLHLKKPSLVRRPIR